ncbi:MAG: carbohydrate kinase family protein [Bacteroidota bacterium]
MQRQKIITVVGASNVDITGFSNEKLIYQDANIGTMKTSVGGVGRNIAENLLRLGFTINLISVFGDDPLSKYLIKSCKDIELTIENSLFLQNASASTFLATMDENNDLAVGISAMDIYDQIDNEFILSRIPIINRSDYVVLETNMPENILQLIADNVIEAKLVLDTVSGVKALKAKNILSKLYILKTNLIEAQMLSGMEVTESKDYDKLVSFFLDQGVQNVFITLGKEGVVFGNKEIIKTHKPIRTKVTNTIGAGDSFVSGLIYGDSKAYSIEEVARYGMASASINVQHDSAVSPEMNLVNLAKIINK